MKSGNDIKQTLRIAGIELNMLFYSPVAWLVLVIFSVYLLLAFSSFFFTGAADQSIIDAGNAQELASTNNGVKNYAGSRGAQLADYVMEKTIELNDSYLKGIPYKDIIQMRRTLIQIMDNMGALVVGNVVAFVVAMLAIKFFISYVTKYGFKAFGWYRIIVGAIILALLFTGHSLEMA